MRSTLRRDAESAGGPLLSARGLTKIYRLGSVEVPAIRAVTVAFEAGELVCVQGASGCGKASFANVLAGLDLPSSGELRYRGVDLTVADPQARERYRRSAVGHLSPLARLVSGLSVEESLGLAAEDRTPAVPVATLLGLVGLLDRGDDTAELLTPEEQRRVLLACAVARRPELLICEEPTAGLDAPGRAAVVEALGAICSGLGLLTIVVSGDPAVAQMAPRVIRFAGGRLVADLRARRGRSPSSGPVSPTAPVPASPAAPSTTASPPSPSSPPSSS